MRECIDTILYAIRSDIADGVLLTTDISGNGTSNVSKMYETNKKTQIARERRAYIIIILGLCETIWIKAVEMKLKAGSAVLYSGHDFENASQIESVTDS